MDRLAYRIEPASTAYLTELSRLYIAYRVFYGESAEEECALAFIRGRGGIFWRGTTLLERLALCT
jgi:hypothetical protein